TAEAARRVALFVVDAGAVGGEMPARVTLLAEEIEDGHDVLPHEDLSASQTHLKAWIVRESLPQRFERHLLAPLPLDVQEIPDVAELAVQVAPHGRLVDCPHGQPVSA